MSGFCFLKHGVQTRNDQFFAKRMMKEEYEQARVTRDESEYREEVV